MSTRTMMAMTLKWAMIHGDSMMSKPDWLVKRSRTDWLWVENGKMGKRVCGFGKWVLKKLEKAP